jgi:leader peptidase (prepilin peptidase)/N-methyltransferase
MDAISFFTYAIVAVFGLCIGSFLNVVIYRLETGESIMKGRSHCPVCSHTLSWLDLVPVASFLWLSGKCRYCRTGISWQYPAVEIMTGLVFLLIFNYQFFPRGGIPFAGQFLNLLLLWYVVGSLIVIFMYDLKYYLIPDVVLFPAIIAALAYQFFSGHIISALVAAALACGFFLAIFLISRGRWMGFGDVKLVFLLGLMVGFPNILPALFLSFLFGAIIGTVLLAQKKKHLQSEVPFAPFLIAGALAGLFWGPELIHWYTRFFLL